MSNRGIKSVLGIIFITVMLLSGCAIKNGHKKVQMLMLIRQLSRLMRQQRVQKMNQVLRKRLLNLQMIKL